jgi:hypothetical protein
MVTFEAAQTVARFSKGAYALPKVQLKSAGFARGHILMQTAVLGSFLSF